MRLWAREPEVVEAIARRRENTPFLPGILLPPTLEATSEPAHAVANAHLLVLAVPSRWMRSVCRSLAGLVPDGVPLLTVTKGLEIASGKRMSEVAREELPGSGRWPRYPARTWRRRLRAGCPAATVIASPDAALAAGRRSCS